MQVGNHGWILTFHTVAGQVVGDQYAVVEDKGDGPDLMAVEDTVVAAVVVRNHWWAADLCSMRSAQGSHNHFAVAALAAVFATLRLMALNLGKALRSGRPLSEIVPEAQG